MQVIENVRFEHGLTYTLGREQISTGCLMLNNEGIIKLQLTVENLRVFAFGF
jgi:hypothetical protein